MGAYYNEFDPKAAQWLRQLIKNGVIADGEVDERSIIDVQADDLRGFTQHHFFAGIGGWSYALRLAGWDDTRPVCTASLPCQPFSVAGAQKGIDDERHLLPHFIELVKQCNFQTIFGEQVPGAIKHGWLDDLCTEMEREKYRVGQIVLTAAGEGAPHIRQRLYWVADSSKQRQSGQPLYTTENQDREINRIISTGNINSRVSNTENRNGRPESQLTASSGRESRNQFGGDGSCGGVGISSSLRLESERAELETAGATRTSEIFDGLANTIDSSNRGEIGGINGEKNGRAIGNREIINQSRESIGASAYDDWSEPDWLYCRDEKYRPIKSSIEPLANGLPRGVGYSSDPSESIDANNTQEARVMRLKGYGNAIVPQVAASFIKAFMQC